MQPSGGASCGDDGRRGVREEGGREGGEARHGSQGYRQRHGDHDGGEDGALGAGPQDRVLSAGDRHQGGGRCRPARRYALAEDAAGLKQQSLVPVGLVQARSVPD